MKKFGLLILLFSISALAQSVWINEIDADQISTDANEFIELVGISGLDITGYKIILFNGSDNTPPNDYLIQTLTSFTFLNELNGYGFFVLGSNNVLEKDQVLGTGETNLIQNGSPDGIALFDNLNNLVFQFSYGGTFTGTATGYPDVVFTSSRCAVDGTTLSMGFLNNSRPIDADFGLNNLILTPGAANTDGTNNQALPVELTSFSATTIGSTVKLSWNTATEVNNYGFEIERYELSAERQAWEKIGFVNGNGNSNSPKSYSFVDDKVNAGKYSYRLKQIDNDGQFEYSKSIEVDLDAPKKFELSQNYPNPFNPITTIRFNLQEASNVKLTLFNLLGQEIKTLVNEFKESGAHTINFDASELNSGMYIYKIEAGTFVQTRKMTLIK